MIYEHWAIISVVVLVGWTAFKSVLREEYVTQEDFDDRVELVDAQIALMAEDKTVEYKLANIERQIAEVKSSLQKNNDMLFQLMIAMNPTGRVTQ